VSRLAELPVISTTFDLDTGQWCLYATSYQRTEVAGPRLFRSPPHPDIRFQHDNQESAERDAATLQEYLTNPPKPKRPKKEVEPEEIVDPVWE